MDEIIEINFSDMVRTEISIGSQQISWGITQHGNVICLFLIFEKNIKTNQNQIIYKKCLSKLVIPTTYHQVASF